MDAERDATAGEVVLVFMEKSFSVPQAVEMKLKL